MSSLLPLYLAYIRPHLEYAATLWDLYQQGLINSLERECRSFHLRCAPKTVVPNTSLCFSHATCPHASRRHYLKLCLLYQIVNGNLNSPMAPIVPRNLSRSLRNTCTLDLERPVTRTNAHWSSFSPHTIALWNAYLHLLRTASHCVLLNRLYCVIHLIPHLIPNT